MKLFFASDIHGSLPACQKMLAAFERSGADKLILLGDLLYHGPRNPLPEGYDPKGVAALLNSYKERLISVRGNCDAEVDQMLLDFPCLADYALIFSDGHQFYITHGHLHDRDHLPPIPKSTIFVHGHFHVPMLDEKDGIYILNPSSVSLPKQGEASYALYSAHSLTIHNLEDDIKLVGMKI